MLGRPRSAGGGRGGFRAGGPLNGQGPSGVPRGAAGGLWELGAGAGGGAAPADREQRGSGGRRQLLASGAAGKAGCAPGGGFGRSLPGGAGGKGLSPSRASSRGETPAAPRRGFAARARSPTRGCVRCRVTLYFGMPWLHVPCEASWPPCVPGLERTPCSGVGLSSVNWSLSALEIEITSFLSRGCMGWCLKSGFSHH